MSIHVGKTRGSSLFKLVDWATPGGFRGTPSTAFDGGYLQQVGFGGPEPYIAMFAEGLKRDKAGASLTVTPEYDRDWNLTLQVEMTNFSDTTYSADNKAMLGAALLENHPDPYFSISGTHVSPSSSICGDLEPGGTLRCALPMNYVDPEALKEGELFVTLTYQPDPAAPAHDSVQAVLVPTKNINVPPKDQKPVVANEIEDIMAGVGESMTIDLSETFDDPDGENAEIEKEIVFNSKKDVVEAMIEGDELTLNFLAEGRAKIILRGTSDGKKVDTNFVVEVEQRESNIFLPMLVRKFEAGQ